MKLRHRVEPRLCLSPLFQKSMAGWQTVPLGLALWLVPGLLPTLNFRMTAGGPDDANPIPQTTNQR